MTPAQLKSSILQRAIQGKLVPQIPSEGTGEQLYQQIQKEKQAMRKAPPPRGGVGGGAKKEKPLPPISEDEIPFEIPETWRWCRIQDIAILNPKNNLPDDLDTAFIPMALIGDEYKNEHTFEVKKWISIKKGFTHFANNDVGFAKITPCFQNRKSVIFHNLINGYGAGTTELSIVRIINNLISNKYLLWFFKSEYFISNGVKSFTGTAGQQRIHKDYLATCLFPLPPLAEQRRIVAKIEELMPLIDRYEKAWTQLEAMNKKFPGDLKKSILQMAIQGRLVPQIPAEGSGEELYQQIQNEKQALIKAGKIKKDKPLPPISEDEIPFEIPEGWRWCRFDDVFYHVGNKTNQILAKDVKKIGKYPAVSQGLELIDGYCDDDEKVIYDIPLIMFGDHTRNVKYIDFPFVISADGTKFLKSIIVNSKYLYYWMKISAEQLRNRGYARHFSLLSKLLIPLPPLAEQRRIVAKIEELMPLIERLERS